MLQCPLLAYPYILDDLQKFNENDRKCVVKWRMRFDDTKKEEVENNENMSRLLNVIIKFNLLNIIAI